MKLYRYFSVKYWKCHKKRLFLLFFTIMMGQALLMCALFLDRNEKMSTMENELYILGDYDIVAYDVDIRMFNKMHSKAGVQQIGYYDRFGHVSLSGETDKYAACYFDKKSSIKMFHMTCLAGGYPKRDNQVAADYITLKKLGVNPVPGEKIALDVYDKNGEVIAQREYEISGIFAWQDENAWGGALRYPVYFDEGEYEMPVFVFDNRIQQYQYGETLCVFAATTWDDTESRLYEVFADDFQRDENFNKKLHAVNGRRYAYQYMLGITTTIWEDYGDARMSTIQRAIREGNIHMDIISTVVMPVILVLISILIVLSVGWIEGIILNDRKSQIVIMRSMGMPLVKINQYLIYEILFILIVSIGMGYVTGIALYKLISVILNTFFDIMFSPVFKVDEIIALVTIDPYIVPTVVIGSFVMLIAVTKIVFMGSKEPFAMLLSDDRHNNKKAGRRMSESLIKKGWLPLLKRRFSYNSRGIGLIFAVVIVFGFVGYQFFVNMAEHRAVEMNENYMEQLAEFENTPILSPAEVQYNQTITIFYLIMILLVLEGIISISISLYFMVYTNMKKYAVLMAVGMNRRQLAKLILMQNIRFPILGGLSAILIAGMGQIGLQWMNKNIDMLFEKLESSFLNWWYICTFDLFTGKWYFVWILIVAVFIIILILATLPQLRYLSKKSVLESIRKDDI